MRILAIRGENLASLAGRFEIEFEREPLRSAGLFAITGETGAGKSTILDALCLALYDKFPRVVAPGGAEGAPDPSGDTLASGDPRAILRRGAGRGFAEADFVARDGRRYRARCDLMRARGKAAGKLQNRGRSLWRIDENGEMIEAVESGVEPVNRRIVDLTDLTFDQFRRTALLAQGDFDAFLRADAKERADLLEKITGAEIYGVLSRRAYERADAAKRALATLEERQAEIGVMADEERAAMGAEMAHIAARRASLAAESQETQAALRRLDARAQVQAKLAEAEKSRAAADRALQELAPQRRTLADLARVEPLRGPRDEARKAESLVAESQAAAAQARARVEAAGAALELAQTRERAARAALEAAAEDIERFQPVWTQAAALDARVEALDKETAKARADEECALRRFDKKRAALAQARAQEQAAAAQCDSARKAFDALAPAQPLSERWRDIDDWLSKRARFAKEAGETSRALEKALDEATRAQDMRAAFDEADRKDRDALAALLAQLREREAALSKLDPPAAHRRSEELARAHELLQAMAQWARAYEAAQAKATDATGDIARLAEEEAALAQVLAALRATRAAQAAQKEEAERLGELAEAAADAQIATLRSRLEDGEPCPVCGATDHPFRHSSEAARALVETLRAKREAARRALAQTDAEIASDSARAAKMRALREDAARRREEAQKALEDARREYAARLAQRPHRDAPENIDAALEPIDALIRTVADERVALRKIGESAQRLGGEIDRLRKAADAHRDAIEKREAARAETEALGRRAGEDRARFEEALKAARERVESLDRALAPFLTLCDLTTGDLDRAAADARRRLEEAGARFRDAQKALEKAETGLAALVPEIASLAAEERALAQQAQAAAKARIEREADLAAAREARGALLDGEATAPHRARIEEKHKAARVAHEGARDALSQAEKDKAASDERAAGAEQALEKAQAALAAAQEAFGAALTAARADEETAAALLAISREDAEAMRAGVEEALSALRAAEAAVEQRRRDVAEAEAAGGPETPREALAARETALAGELEALLRRDEALQQRLAQDDEARARAETLAGEIASARATRKIWDEVNEAIGSANGDKFRRFAQSVTLEQLVALANRRLALLSPRYRLERAGEAGSLGLQIVDRDLGDERRSTRSLSGGERFLASLALAMALAGLEGRDSFVDTLFIDEGFGALDSATLDVAIDALENLQGQGRKVGVISHVESLQQRIATKIRVERRGGGVSAMSLQAPGYGA